ncbi:MAG TPA: GNAT family N-acetyltransferase [Mycobacteriales bacterium]|nr:GNAT family N-acetyltransferase [Mycobacteriales bacterium]
MSVPLVVRDLSPADLPCCDWAGMPPHLDYVAAALDRARAGEVDYLAVCGPVGLPVGIGGVDYTVRPDAGTLYQLAVHPALQSCGIGTTLIRAAEERIRARGLRRAALSVEETNPRAQALYLRLGYVPCGSELHSWDIANPDGSSARYQTRCTEMRKHL